MKIWYLISIRPIVGQCSYPRSIRGQSVSANLTCSCYQFPDNLPEISNICKQSNQGCGISVTGCHKGTVFTLHLHLNNQPVKRKLKTERSKCLYALLTHLGDKTGDIIYILPYTLLQIASSLLIIFVFTNEDSVSLSYLSVFCSVQ